MGRRASVGVDWGTLPEVLQVNGALLGRTTKACRRHHWSGAAFLVDVNDETPPAGAASRRPYKLPVSVLVLVYTPKLDVLLLERADRPGFWQSVTGSQIAGETLEQTARRELFEETGVDAASYRLLDWGKHNVFEIYPHWQYRYAPGVTHNTEHVFALEVPEGTTISLAPREHTAYVWLPWRQAADKAFSWTNVEAILELPSRLARSDAAAQGT